MLAWCPSEFVSVILVGHCSGCCNDVLVNTTTLSTRPTLYHPTILSRIACTQWLDAAAYACLDHVVCMVCVSVCVLITRVSRAMPRNQVLDDAHIGAIWKIRLNDTCSETTRPFATVTMATCAIFQFVGDITDTLQTTDVHRYGYGYGYIPAENSRVHRRVWVEVLV